MDAMNHAGPYRPQELGGLPVAAPADEVHAVVPAVSQGNDGRAIDRAPAITHPDKEGNDSARSGIGRRGIVQASPGGRTIRIAQGIQGFCPQVRHSRNDIEAHIPLVEIAPPGNQHLMRKEALNISLKPMEQVHMLLDPQRRLGRLHQTDAIILPGLSWRRLPFQ
jgi:hypothetical protein